MSELVSQLAMRLPELAQQIITEYVVDDATTPYFLANPDAPSQHQSQWHQFGIVTHSTRAVAAYENEVPDYLREWGLEDRVLSYLDRLIDGRSRHELLSIGHLVHDVGKFAVRRTVVKDGVLRFTFKGHERFSGSIIRSELFDFINTEFDISPAQREYIAQCGEHHYDIGILRESAKSSPEGYTMAFTGTDEFRHQAQAIWERQPELAEEIGILFLADNLSKTDIRMKNVETDADIEAQSSNIAAVISKRGLEPDLIKMAKQLPVNIAVARTYLKN